MIISIFIFLGAALINFISLLLSGISFALASSTTLAEFFNNFQKGISYIFSPLFYFRDYLPINQILKMFGFLVSMWAIIKGIKMALWIFGYILGKRTTMDFKDVKK